MATLAPRKRAVKLSAAALAGIATASVAFQPVHCGASHPRVSWETASANRPSEADESHQDPSRARKVPPVDDAAKDPSFKAFRDTLIDAVKRKDTQFILSVVEPNIENDFGGGNGVENFKAKWRLAKTAESKLWAELDRILSMGGTFRVEEGKKSFWAPYVYSAWPDDFECGDDAQCYAVTGDHINVRREPASTAPIVASLSYDIVKSK